MECNNPQHKDGAWESVSALGKELADTIHDRAMLLATLKVALVEIFILEGASDIYMQIESIVDKFELRAVLEQAKKVREE